MQWFEKLADLYVSDTSAHEQDRPLAAGDSSSKGGGQIGPEQFRLSDGTI